VSEALAKLLLALRNLKDALKAAVGELRDERPPPQRQETERC
jgi:hypothetical protein